MRIVFYGYRDWAFDIFKNIDLKDKLLITNQNYDIIKKIKPEIVFFVGWSYIVPKDIIENYYCICLHPSPLPKYRGGSPIQNQLINGETWSAITLFKMDEGIDTGDIINQYGFSLKGNLKQIFKRIIHNSTNSINIVIENFDIFKNEINLKKQDENRATFFKRRKPSDSEITIEEIQNSTPKRLYNKIRGLSDPYPNAYIKCKNGEKLYILKTKHEK